jgi:hypothetical protein
METDSDQADSAATSLYYSMNPSGSEVVSKQAFISALCEEERQRILQDTSLGDAVEASDETAVEALLAKGTDIDEFDEVRLTPPTHHTIAYYSCFRTLNDAGLTGVDDADALGQLKCMSLSHPNGCWLPPFSLSVPFFSPCMIPLRPHLRTKPHMNKSSHSHYAFSRLP